METIEKIVSARRKMIESKAFKEGHRTSARAFTRERKLIFPWLIVLIIKKSVKSIPLRLNEFLSWLEAPTVSNRAFTQARANLKHTAFIALNDLMVKMSYEEGDYKRYRGFRLLAIDGSKVRLPEGQEIQEHFGAISYSNPYQQVKGEHNYAQVSVLYDVLNRIALTGEFAKARAYEVDLGIKPLGYTQSGDLILGARNSASYRFLDKLGSTDFIIRCSANSFQVARAMLKGPGTDSQVVNLKLNRQKSIPVRFIRVILSPLESEVLVTSLVDEFTYPNELFKELYHLRWGIETFYGFLKTRLE